MQSYALCFLGDASRMVEFFDLISFFGVAALFAWLAYAPLRTQRLSEGELKKQGKAKENLDKITDYFLISFLSYSVAAVSDYVYHHRIFIVLAYNQRWVPLFIIGTSFVLGLFNLFVPIIYLRNRNLGDIDLPPFAITFYFAVFTAAATAMWVIDLVIAMTFVGQVLSVLSGLMVYVGATRGIKHWRDWRDRRLRSFLNNALMMSPVLVVFLLLIFRV